MGNILMNNRNGNVLNSSNPAMDRLNYHYYPNSNKLAYVGDSVPDSWYKNDLDNQTSTTNYVYDSSGELTLDKSDTSHFYWNPYGKVDSIVQPRESVIFAYDASGNRVEKTVRSVGKTKTTYFVRDAQGNIMSDYTHLTKYDKDVYAQNELYMYGSKRLGVMDIDRTLSLDTVGTNASYGFGNKKIDTTNIHYSRIKGEKEYELSDWRGNVNVVITDRRAYDSNGVYGADLVNATDYFAFGSEKPGRAWRAGDNSKYQYAFNGKENDNEVEGEGNFQDYGRRMYDDRLGRFISVDPITAKYPYYSPYQFAGDKPIWAVDMDGLEDVIYFHVKQLNGRETTTIIKQETGGAGHGRLDLYATMEQVEYHDPGDDENFNRYSNYVPVVDDSKTTMSKSIWDRVLDLNDDMKETEYTLPIAVVIMNEKADDGNIGDKANKSPEIKIGTKILQINGALLDMVALAGDQLRDEPGKEMNFSEQGKDAIQNQNTGPDPKASEMHDSCVNDGCGKTGPVNSLGYPHKKVEVPGPYKENKKNDSSGGSNSSGSPSGSGN